MLAAQPSGITCWVAALLACQIALLQMIVKQRQVVGLGNKMAGGRIVEHIGSVTGGDDESFFRVRQLHAQAATDAPAQAAGRRAAEISRRLAQTEHFAADAMVAQHDRVAVAH